MIGIPLCVTCKHRREGMTCEAFPDEIPQEIIALRVDHRKPYRGDHGIQYEPKGEEKADEPDFHKGDAEWNPELHPRAPAGSSEGGQFTSDGGGGGGSSEGETGGATIRPQAKETFEPKMPAGYEEHPALKDWTERALDIPNREAAINDWKKLSDDQKVAIAQPSKTIDPYVSTLVGSRAWPETGDAKRDISERVRQFRDEIGTGVTAKAGLAHLQGLHDDLTKLGVDPESVTLMTRHATDSLIAQEMESQGRILGDHGIRHLTGDVEFARQFQSILPGGMTDKESVLYRVVGLYHDVGYMAPTTRAGLQDGHEPLSADYFKANVAPLYEKAFGKEWADEATRLVGNHNSTKIDYQGDPHLTSFSLADNLAIFQSEKMPPMLRAVPENTDVLVRFAKSGMTEDGRNAAIAQCLANIDKHDEFGSRVRERFKKAAAEISAFYAKGALGMIGAKVEKIGWTGDHIKIALTRTKANEALGRILDLHQQGFKKLAKTWKADPESLLKTGDLELKSNTGTTLVEFKLTDSWRKIDFAAFDGVSVAEWVEDSSGISKYDEDQARDDRGRWTRDGDMDEGGAKPASSTRPSRDVIVKPGGDWMDLVTVLATVGKAKAPTYQTPSELHNLLRDEAQDWRENLPSKQTRELYDYTLDGYDTLNHYLRGTLDWEQDEDADAKLDKKTAAITHALADAPKMEEDVVVYRGMKAKWLGDLKVGQTYEDKGFVSTSTNVNVAMSFPQRVQFESEKALVRVVIPKGAQAAYLAADERHRASSEDEVLLQRNAQFKVTRIATNGENGLFNRTVYEMRYVGSKVDLDKVAKIHHERPHHEDDDAYDWHFTWDEDDLELVDDDEYERLKAEDYAEQYALSQELGIPVDLVMKVENTWAKYVPRDENGKWITLDSILGVSDEKGHTNAEKYHEGRAAYLEAKGAKPEVIEAHKAAAGEHAKALQAIKNGSVGVIGLLSGSAHFLTQKAKELEQAEGGWKPKPLSPAKQAAAAEKAQTRDDHDKAATFHTKMAKKEDKQGNSEVAAAHRMAATSHALARDLALTHPDAKNVAEASRELSKKANEATRQVAEAKKNPQPAPEPKVTPAEKPKEPEPVLMNPIEAAEAKAALLFTPAGKLGKPDKSIDIVDYQGKATEVAAWKTPVEGIVVADKANIGEPGKYSLTHQATGSAISTFASPEHAMAVATLMAGSGKVGDFFTTFDTKDEFYEKPKGERDAILAAMNDAKSKAEDLKDKAEAEPKPTFKPTMSPVAAAVPAAAAATTHDSDKKNATKASTMEEHDAAEKWHREKAAKYDSMEEKELAEVHADAALSHAIASQYLKDGKYNDALKATEIAQTNSERAISEQDKAEAKWQGWAEKAISVTAHNAAVAYHNMKGDEYGWNGNKLAQEAHYAAALSHKKAALGLTSDDPAMYSLGAAAREASKQAREVTNPKPPAAEKTLVISAAGKTAEQAITETEHKESADYHMQMSAHYHDQKKEDLAAAHNDARYDHLAAYNSLKSGDSTAASDEWSRKAQEASIKVHAMMREAEGVEPQSKAKKILTDKLEPSAAAAEKAKTLGDHEQAAAFHRKMAEAEYEAKHVEVAAIHNEAADAHILAFTKKSSGVYESFGEKAREASVKANAASRKAYEDDKPAKPVKEGKPIKPPGKLDLEFKPTGARIKNTIIVEKGKYNDYSWKTVLATALGTAHVTGNSDPLDTEDEHKYHSTMIQRFSTWRNDLEYEEGASLTSYQGSGYDPMNNVCRKGTDSVSAESMYKGRVKNLEAALDTTPTCAPDRDLVTWRGIKPKYIDLPVGSIVIDRGFASCTVAFGTGEGFAKSEKAKDSKGNEITRYGMARVIFPKGSKAAYLGDSSNYEGSYEYEVLTNRAPVFQITAKAKTADEKYVMTELRFLGYAPEHAPLGTGDEVQEWLKAHGRKV